jgi:hypothetical protein
MEPAFTDRSIRASEELLVQNVQTFVDLVARSSKNSNDWSKPFNLSQWSTYLNYDIMGDLVFGRQFHTMTSETNRFVPGLITNSTAFINTVRLACISLLSWQYTKPAIIADHSHRLHQSHSRLSHVVSSQVVFSASPSSVVTWPETSKSFFNTLRMSWKSASRLKRRNAEDRKTLCTIFSMLKIR